jgi:hypothetical protein
MKPYNEIVEHYELEYDWFVQNNPSNNLPYHNLFHTQCMIENCYDGAQYYNLPYDATQQLLTAALFHDFAHTGGKELDSENIRRALHDGLWKLYGGELPKLIWECVKCTQYPYVREPFTIEQRIIRDADLMQFRFSNWEEMLFVNLKKEMEEMRRCSISDEEMLVGQRKFWSDVTFFTDWGKMCLNQAPHSFREKMGVQHVWYHGLSK